MEQQQHIAEQGSKSRESPDGIRPEGRRQGGEATRVSGLLRRRKRTDRRRLCWDALGGLE